MLPATADLAHGQQLLDLTGDGRPDIVDLRGAGAGFHGGTADGGWNPLRRVRQVHHRPDPPHEDLGGIQRASDMLLEGHRAVPDQEDLVAEREAPGLLVENEEPSAPNRPRRRP